MPTFACRVCGDEFSLPQGVLDRYPGWTPGLCRRHRDDATKRESGSAPKKSRSRASGGPLLTPAEVLEKFDDGPTDGVFTDGGAVPNPGPGGWGAVYVLEDQVVAEAHGHDPETTNNRMELTALIKAAELVPDGTAAVVYSDSKLAIQTITEWARGWERRGWKRKSGPVENLDLVKQAYSAYQRRRELKLEWVRGHTGVRWNEYADALASEWRRG